MADREYRIQAPDGSILRIVGPDDATPEQLQAAAQRAFAARQTPSETRITSEVQAQRDEGRLPILQAEREQIAQQAQTGDQRAVENLQAIDREIARVARRTAPARPAAAQAVQPSMMQPTAEQTARAAEIPRAIGVPEPQRPAEPPPGLIDRIVGELEAAGALISGATTAPISAANAAVSEFVRQLMSGRLGTEEGNVAGEQAIKRGMAAGTYAPRTELGREYTGRIAGALQQVPPYVPVSAPAVAPGAAAVQQARARAAQPRAVPMPRIEPTLEAAPQAAQQAGRAPMPTPQIPELDVTLQGVTRPTAGAVVQRGAAGAAGVPVEVERRAVAASMPVPFAGETGLTKGQATRDFAQLQFEKESAKFAELGEPLRERVQRQTANFIQNFDALIDMAQPISRDRRGIGILVDKAVADKAEVKRTEIRKAYQDAEAAGQMKDPAELTPLASTLTDLNRFEGVSKNIPAIRREAQRLGAITVDESGVLVPGKLSIADSETLRQFVNEATDWTDRRESLFARKINASIDAATEGKGGELYKKARKLRADFASEFENVGLTSKLLGTKRGTDERQIAFEDVFDKVILLSPLDEMNKLRGTLLTAGPDGRQAWADLKAKGIDYIKESALSPSQRDAAGNPLLSPDKLQKVVKSLDDTGKLESLYGKKQAQTLRDLAELSTVIYTAPPGAINTSNTASALRVALDSLLTFGATGVPAPVLTTLQQANKYVKDRKVKARINDALRQTK